LSDVAHLAMKCPDANQLRCSYSRVS